MAMDQSNYPIDLNRALPSLPLSLDRTPKPALQPTPHVVLRDDIPTTSSVENTANTAKKQFQNITRDLMQPFVTELPPKACLPSELLDPVKYSPSETSSKTRSSQNTKMSSL